MRLRSTLPQMLRVVTKVPLGPLVIRNHLFPTEVVTPLLEKVNRTPAIVLVLLPESQPT